MTSKLRIIQAYKQLQKNLLYAALPKYDLIFLIKEDQKGKIFIECSF
jgi:hypothetical protein